LTRSSNLLSRRGFLRSTAGAAISAPFLNLGRYRLFAGYLGTYSARTVELVESSLVIDMLSLLDMPRMFLAGTRGEDPNGFSREDLLRIMESGIDVFHPAIGMGGPTVYEDTLTFLASFNGLVAQHPDLVMRIDSISDLEALEGSAGLGILLGTQNSDQFRTADDVRSFHHLGLRVSQLTYNSQNRLGSGSTDRADGGISDFGASIVEAMNTVGMAVDVSHCGDRTTLDAFELSTAPVLITHSNCRALTEGHPRCKTDEAIVEMAATGGVMGITSVRNFVKNVEPTTIEDYIDHIDHVADLVGVEHVGIGTDTDLNGYDDLPRDFYEQLKSGYKDTYGFRDKIDIEGLDHPKKMFDLVEALTRRGYGDTEIRAILGGNFKRALGEIWDRAAPAGDPPTPDETAPPPADERPARADSGRSDR
jgi:membrane dipeptidase